MATRRDFVMIARVLRTASLDNDDRAALASRFTRELEAVTPGFNAQQFMYECTRRPRPEDSTTEAVTPTPAETGGRS